MLIDSKVSSCVQGIQRLQKLHVHGMPRNCTQQSQLQWISARMSLSLKCQVQAVGALLAVMEKVTCLLVAHIIEQMNSSPADCLAKQLFEILDYL